jgi:hypothetical protein
MAPANIESAMDAARRGRCTALKSSGNERSSRPFRIAKPKRFDLKSIASSVLPGERGRDPTILVPLTNRPCARAHGLWESRHISHLNSSKAIRDKR